MQPNERRAEITVFEKIGGPLTKRFALRDGKIISDGSACRMVNGFAEPRYSPASIGTPIGGKNGGRTSES